MKFLAVVVLVAIVGVALADPIDKADIKAKVDAQKEACAADLHLTDDEFNNIKNLKFDNPTENMKCYAKCFFEKAGMIKDDVFQKDVFVEKVKPIVGEENAKKVVDELCKFEGKNDCEHAFDFYTCVAKEKQKYIEKIKAQ